MKKSALLNGRKEKLREQQRVPLRKELLDVQSVRKDFPVLEQKVYGKPLIYFDNAATSQKPRSVIETIRNYYLCQNANIHRGIHYLSEQATKDYEDAREKIKSFIHAKDLREIIFVRGATEAINLVAHSFGRKFLHKGDEIILSLMEHHSNIVPWQMLSEEQGIKIKVVPVNESGELILEEYEKMLNPKTKLVAVTHVSNALGTVNPVKKMIELAHRVQIPVLLDGAQAVPHLSVDVQELDCDFYLFSGHKLYGPTGIGVLYGKLEHLEAMPPYQGGGDMIRLVTFGKTLYNDLPYKFEAGTPPIAGSIGLGAAIDYLQKTGIEKIFAYEEELLDYATKALSQVKGLKIIGTAKEKVGVLSFVLDGVHPHDAGTVLDREGIAIRAGHHCAMPLMQHFGLAATCRASFAFYNTKEEVNALVVAIEKTKRMFS